VLTDTRLNINQAPRQALRRQGGPLSGCFIVDGKPFVPYCMGIHSIGQIDRLQDIKDHGFNTICADLAGR